jgi:hypothetical protein
VTTGMYKSIQEILSVLRIVHEDALVDGDAFDLRHLK